MVKINVKCNKNNTHIYVCSLKGQFVYKASCGTLKLTNVKKAAHFKAEKLSSYVVTLLVKKGFFGGYLFLKGYGRGRNGILKGFKENQFNLVKIYQVNCLAFNGCKQKKQRRL